MQILDDLSIDLLPPGELIFRTKTKQLLNETYHFVHVYQNIDGLEVYVDSMVSGCRDVLFEQVRKTYNFNVNIKPRTFSNFLDWYYTINPSSKDGISLNHLLLISKKFQR